jgi:hypothetical protein
MIEFGPLAHGLGFKCNILIFYFLDIRQGLNLSKAYFPHLCHEDIADSTLKDD